MNGTALASAQAPAQAPAPVRGGIGFYVDAEGVEALFSDLVVTELPRGGR